MLAVLLVKRYRGHAGQTLPKSLLVSEQGLTYLLNGDGDADGVGGGDGIKNPDGSLGGGDDPVNNQGN